MGIAILINTIKRTAQNAKDRDKSWVGAILYTIALWLIFGFIGFVISGLTMTLSHNESSPPVIDLLWLIFIYVTCLIFCILGSFIANKISTKSVKFRSVKVSTQKDYVDYFSDDELLNNPCKIKIIIDRDWFSILYNCSFTLNDEDLGILKQNQGVIVSTNKRKNTLKAKRQRDGACLDEYEFIIPDGGEVEIHFFDRDFDNSKTKIIKGHLPLIDKRKVL